MGEAAVEPGAYLSSRVVATAAGLYAVLGGAVTLVGWAGGIYRLTDWGGIGISMKANAAIASLAAGGALVLAVIAPGKDTLRKSLAAIATALGGLTLLEHIAGLDFGIDTLLFYEPENTRATAAPGRMGPPASLAFLCLGVALLLSRGGSRARYSSIGLGLLILFMATLSLIGYWYDAQAMYTIPRLTGIAPQTVSLLMALGVGVVAANPTHEPVRMIFEASNAGALTRRLMPFALLVPLLVGYVRVQGERAGLYNAPIGTALRSAVEVVLIGAILWWALRAIRARDLREEAAHRELRERDQRLTETLESLTDGYLTLDSERRFLYLNSAAERLVARPREQLLGRTLSEVFPQLVGQPLFNALERAARSNLMIEVEGTDLTQGQRYLSQRIFPGRDGDLTMYLQDITARKRAEESIQDADRRKDAFLATLAHELRNPLAPVRNAAKVLLSPSAPASTIQWGAQIIDRQVNHMARLLDDLLDVSRITRNRLVLQKEWLDLRTVLQNAIEAVRPAMEARNQALEFRPLVRPIHVEGDPVRLAQVFSNLLNNAAKYSPPETRITVAVTETSEEIGVLVKDEGMGIEPELLPRIFEMFFQNDRSQSHSQGGLGIGLSLARALVELHSGRIEAVSAGADQGATFTIWLPRLKPEVDASRLLPSTSLESDVKRRVLVVDDMPDNADSLARLLETLGHVVRTAYGGAEALVVAEAFRPDTAFLDIGMPEMDGLQVCQRMRQWEWAQSITIIALTGWGQPQDRLRTVAAGFDHHLVKPADAAALAALLNDVRERSAQH